MVFCVDQEHAAAVTKRINNERSSRAGASPAPTGRGGDVGATLAVAQNVSPELLARLLEAPDADAYDLLAHLAFNAPLVSRDERAKAFLNRNQDFLGHFKGKAREWETFAREASGLVGSLDRLGYWPEIEARLVQACEVTRTHLGDKQLEAQVLLDSGRMAYMQAKMTAALESYRQALELFRAVGDRLGEANTLQAIGDVQQFRDERDAALESYRQALELFRAVGDRLGEANTLKAIGNLHLDQGDGERGLEMLDQALNLYRLVGDRVGQANIYWGLGLRLVNNGALQEAEPLLAQAVGLAQQFAPGHPTTEHWATVLTQVRAQLAQAKGPETAKPTGEQS